MAKKGSKKLSNSTLITAIALIVIGVLFCVFRSGMLNIMLTVIGVVLVALGIYDAVARKQLILGIVEAVVGVLIIVCGWTILDITLVILGVIFIIYGVYMLIQNLSHIKSAKGADKVLAIVKPIVIFIVGILLIVARWALSDILIIIIGVVAIIEGILMLIK